MAKLDNPDRLKNCGRIVQLLNDCGILYKVCNSYCGIPTHIIAQSDIYGDVHIWPTTLEGKFWIPKTGKRSYFIFNNNLLPNKIKELS